MYTFDGQNNVIILDTGVTSFSVTDLYSKWKEWVIQGTNSKWPQAIRTVGGDPVSVGKFVAPYYFLINGWKVRPHEAAHALSVEGNLFALGSAGEVVPAFAPTLGSFNVLMTMQTSTQALTVATGSGLSSEQNDKLMNALTLLSYLDNKN